MHEALIARLDREMNAGWNDTKLFADLRAALASAPAADLTDDQIDACVGNLGMAPYIVLIGPEEIRKFARKLLAEQASHPQAQVVAQPDAGLVALGDLSHDVLQQIRCLEVGLGGPEPTTDLGKHLNAAIVKYAALDTARAGSTKRAAA